MGGNSSPPHGGRASCCGAFHGCCCGDCPWGGQLLSAGTAACGGCRGCCCGCCQFGVPCGRLASGGGTACVESAAGCWLWFWGDTGLMTWVELDACESSPGVGVPPWGSELTADDRTWSRRTR